VGRPNGVANHRTVLEGLGFEVTEVRSADNGLKVSGELPPNVVLCYMRRSAREGCRLAEELRRTPSTAAARLVALFGYRPAHDARLARDAGFDHLLVLPVSADVLELVLTGMGILPQVDGRGQGYRVPDEG
jgi:CheY-like chemotaxis protein